MTEEMKTETVDPETGEVTEAKPDKAETNKALARARDDGQRSKALAPLAVYDDGEFNNFLDSARFNQLWRVATMFSQSQMVPEHYQGKPADCMIACQMAIRLHVDPFMFMQNTYVVGGKPGMEAKLAIALVNSRGPFTGPIQWKRSGEGKAGSCTAFATHRVTGDLCEATVSWDMVVAEGWADKRGSKWQTMPEIMFRYRAATFLARLYAPECLMGMPTMDELSDIIDGEVTRPSLASIADGGEKKFGFTRETPVALTNDGQPVDTAAEDAQGGDSAAEPEKPATEPTPAPKTNTGERGTPGTQPEEAPPAKGAKGNALFEGSDKGGKKNPGVAH